MADAPRPRRVYLVASGDLRSAANRACWPAQAEMEARLERALAAEGVGAVRAHPFDEQEGHGFISSQRMSMDVFRTLPKDAPVIVAEALWQYSHHLLAGLRAHEGSILTVANWRGRWPGLVGLLNLSGSLTRWLRDQFARELPEAEAYARLFRAALEGVAYGIRHNPETFAEMGAPVRCAVAVGGGTRGGLWVQIVSDVSGQAQLLPEVAVGASYGDAFLAGLAAGVLERWVRGGRPLEPDPSLAELHDARFRAFKDLYASTAPIVHALAAPES